MTRRVLITGAGAPNGIGVTTARKFLATGAKIFITGHSSRVIERSQELIALGGKVSALAGDLTDPQFAKSLIDSAVDFLGGIDILVNNAGMTSATNPAGKESASIEDMEFESWRASFARNIDSLFLLTKEALPQIRNSEAGRIINVASVTGPVMAMRNEIGYGSAKAAVVGFTRGLALDEAERGITVNAIAPGWIATDSQSDHEYQQGLKTPMHRSGTPEEIASAILWLASKEAGYITGQTIVIDGGNSIAEERG
jgi:3-oxoacyl-[acyl-carrier protein] reductase